MARGERGKPVRRTGTLGFRDKRCKLRGGAGEEDRPEANQIRREVAEAVERERLESFRAIEYGREDTVEGMHELDTQAGPLPFIPRGPARNVAFGSRGDNERAADRSGHESRTIACQLQRVLGNNCIIPKPVD